MYKRQDQVSSYLRGQLTVAFAVAIMFMIGFSFTGLDYAVTLGIAAGFLNLIPYLGSFLAMIPAVFLGIVSGPALLIKVLIVFAIEQTVEGRFISPLVLGSQSVSYTHLDVYKRQKLNRGRRTVEILKQKLHAPLPV